MHTRRILLWLALLAALVGSLLAVSVYSSAAPGDTGVNARVGLLVAATIVVSGVLLICATSHFWFRSHRRKR